MLNACDKVKQIDKYIKYQSVNMNSDILHRRLYILFIKLMVFSQKT